MRFGKLFSTAPNSAFSKSVVVFDGQILATLATTRRWSACQYDRWLVFSMSMNATGTWISLSSSNNITTKHCLNGCRTEWNVACVYKATALGLSIGNKSGCDQNGILYHLSRSRSFHSNNSYSKKNLRKHLSSFPDSSTDLSVWFYYKNRPCPFHASQFW